MKQPCVLAIDAMGADNAPAEMVKGAVDAFLTHDISVLLVGRQDELAAELAKHRFDRDRIEIIPATQVIENDESPTVAIRQKKDSSIVVGLSLLKENKAKALISAGSTGALLTGATVKLGRIKGISRPALASLLPTKKGFSLLIDCGANVDCKPEYLVQFALMGSLYMEHVCGVHRPRVFLANIGVEQEKGNELAKEAGALLRAASDIHFSGNLEARDLLEGEADVIVCDGFVGNMLLKCTEGVAKHVLGTIKQELMGSAWSKLGAALARSAFRNVKKKLDPSGVGGAPFLGLRQLVVKVHGSAGSADIVAAAKQAVSFIDGDLAGKIEHALASGEGDSVSPGGDTLG